MYEKDGLVIAIEHVNNKYLLMEIETNKKFQTIDSLIKKLNELNIDYNKDNYFVKKAKIVFEENYR